MKYRFLKKFCCTERNSELCSLPRKGSERNSENLHLFWFDGTELRVVFSSAEGFGTEFRDFLFRGRTGIPSEIIICSDYSVFRGIIFLAEIPNPRWRGARVHEFPYSSRGSALQVQSAGSESAESNRIQTPVWDTRFSISGATLIYSIFVAFNHEIIFSL